MRDEKILVVEDDDIVRRLLVDYLKERSYRHVDGARDGVEALHAVSRTAYGLVVLDLMMPMMSGVDFIDSLTAHTSDPSVKPLQNPPSVIVITAAPPTEVPTETIENRSALVKGVFRKPIDMASLARAVERVFREASSS